MTVASTSTTSTASKKKSKFELKHLPWVAEWLTLAQAISKALQLVFCVVSLAILLTWNIGGPISFLNLVLVDAVYGTQDFRGHWYFYISAMGFVMIYVSVICFLGFVGLHIWAELRTFFALFCTALLFVAAPVLSSSLVEMEYARESQRNQVNYLQPKVAVAVGFVVMLVCVADILLAFLSLRTERKGKRFISEAASIKSANNPQIAEMVSRETPSVVRRIRSNAAAEEDAEEKQPFRQSTV